MLKRMRTLTLLPSLRVHPDDYSTAGPLDGQPVVFVHGAASNRRMWAAQVNDLSDRYRTVTLDLAGHGGRTTEQFSIGASVGELNSLISDLGGSAVVVGHSLGGYVAMSAAAERPDQVTGLVVSGATATYRGFGAIAQRALGGLVGVFPSWFERSARDALQRSVPPALVREVLAGGLSMKAGAHAMWQVPGLHSHRLLAAYPGPVLIINGERDRLSRKQEKAAVRACREGLLRVIEDAGQVAPLSKAGAFNDELRGFLRSL